MKALFMADLHLHNYKPFSTVIDGINSRLLDICKSVEKAFEIADENDCDAVFVAGDIFHTRGNLKPSVIVRAKEVFSHREQDIYMIAGNHDMEYYRGGATALEVFKDMFNIKIIETPTAIIDDTPIVMIPYIHDIAEFKTIYKQMLSDYDPEIIIIHQGIDDFGDKIGIPRTSITADYLLKGHDACVFSGHYHNAECFNASNKVVQIGAICQHNFSDIGEERGVWVYDSDCSGESFKFHPIDVAPKFIEIDKWTEETREKAERNFVRVRGKTEAEIKRITAELSESGIDYVVTLEKEFKTAHESSISIDTPLKMLNKYIDLQKDMKPLKAEILALYGDLSS